MGFDGGLARREALHFCSNYVPRSLSGIAKQLKSVPGFYPNTPPEKLGRQVRALLEPLVAAGLLLRYTPENNCWGRAREMATKANQRLGRPAPRRIGELYQTNFMYSYDPGLPIIELPNPGSEMNFEANVLMHKFEKPKNYTWEMLNLLLAARDKKTRDGLRLFLYSLPLDCSEVELLEGVLEFGYDFRDTEFPFKPSAENAKSFLRGLAEGKRR